MVGYSCPPTSSTPTEPESTGSTVTACPWRPRTLGDWTPREGGPETPLVQLWRTTEIQRSPRTLGVGRVARAISRKGLIAKLDKAFSRYIRKKYANHGGWCTCITCGLSVPWEEIHAGHFVSRGCHALRWSELNVHPQCCGCNTYRGGQLDDYALYIIKTYGQDTLEDLLRLKRTTKRHTIPELKDLLAKYSED